MPWGGLVKPNKKNMKYKIDSLNEQSINTKGNAYIDFKELFATQEYGAFFDKITHVEFNDKFPKITLIQEDSNGKKFGKTFLLPKEVTYQTVLDKIRPLFDGE